MDARLKGTVSVFWIHQRLVLTTRRLYSRVPNFRKCSFLQMPNFILFPVQQRLTLLLRKLSTETTEDTRRVLQSVVLGAWSYTSLYRGNVCVRRAMALSSTERRGGWCPGLVPQGQRSIAFPCNDWGREKIGETMRATSKITLSGLIYSHTWN